MHYDIIIIGSGLGGLTSAAFLAKEGKKVLILEQHSIPGGCATVFTRKGVLCEVGLHEMDLGEYHRDMKHVIFEKLGLNKTLPFVPLPQLWNIKTEKNTYSIPEGIQNAKKELIRLFPHEEKGIETYFKAIDTTSYPIRRLPPDLSFLEFFFYPITSLPTFLKTLFRQDNVGDVLDSMIQDSRLKHILNANLGYFHDDPYSLSWFFHSAAQHSYYNSSVFIKGGSQVLSDQLVNIIKEHGGEIIFKAMAQEIIIENSIAKEVTWKERGKDSIQRASASTIIANCSPHYVYNTMLPEQYKQPALDTMPNGSSLYTVYIIFRKPFVSLFPDSGYSTFIRSEKSLSSPLSSLGKEQKELPVKDREFVFVDYSTIDSGLVKEGDDKSFAVLTGISYLSDWESLSNEEYKQKKEEMAQCLFQRMEQHYPNFKEYIEYYEVSTPKTIQRYIKTPDGTAYGFAQTRYLQDSRIPRQSKKIKNLYFASAWTFPGGGFTGALISGYSTALEIIRPMRQRLLLRVLLCTLVGTLVGTFIAELIDIFL